MPDAPTPPHPVRRQRLRVVVTGSSCSLMVIPRCGREEGNYGELLPEYLADERGEVDVRHTGQWFGMIRDVRRRYESAVRNHFPDVLVLNVGMAECQPNVVPTWLVRHFQTWDRSPHRVARAYRRNVSDRLWMAFRVLQRRTSRWPTYRMPTREYVEDLRRVITMARAETGCLVLVLDLDPPGPRWEHWIPGLEERRKRYQAAQDELITQLGDPMVRPVRVQHHVAEHGTQAVLPDGVHRSPFGHRLVAAALAEEIRSIWGAS